MQPDAFPTAHPLYDPSVDTAPASALNNVFDTITYGKVKSTTPVLVFLLPIFTIISLIIH